MNKQQQIEEMAKVIDDRLIEARGWLGSMNRGKGYWIAQKLVENYQPKLPEDSVVLSREEICELKCQAEEDFNKAYDLGSKETAEKIFKMLISELESNQFLSGKRIIMEVDVENLAKKFDVEIEEL